MDRIKTNILVGYLGPLLCYMGMRTGTNSIVLFLTNNLLFFAMISILFFLYLFETEKKIRIYTFSHLIFYLFYNISYNLVLGILSLLIISFWITEARKIDLEKLEFEETTPIKLFFNENKLYKILISVLIYIGFNVYYTFYS
jgi:hypothetical protein